MKRLLVLYTTLASLVACVWLLLPHAPLFRGANGSLTQARWIFSFGMVAPLLVGAVYGIRATFRLERGNPSRPAWFLLTQWLALFAIGETILIGQLYLTGKDPVSPSVGDLCFVIGYLGLVPGAFLFARVYSASGLPIGPMRERLVVASVTSVVLGLVGAKFLLPLLQVHGEFWEKLTLIGFPILDFVVLIPTAILLRITSRFRGGGIWRIWAGIGVGFVILALADTLCAYTVLENIWSLDPVTYIAYMIGYTLTALGVIWQYEIQCV